MEYDVAFTLRMALDSNLPEVNDVQLLYEGANITEIPKPFVTIQYMQDVPEILSAGHRSHFDTFTFQVGVFARDVDELYRLTSKVRAVLRKSEGHPLFKFDEESGAFVETGELIPFFENGFTPIGNDDNSNVTFSHHGYFDVAVEIIT